MKRAWSIWKFERRAKKAQRARNKEIDLLLKRPHRDARVTERYISGE